MAEIKRRKQIDLDPEYPPGNAYSIDLPNPALIPQAPAPTPAPRQDTFPPGFDLLSDAPKFLAPAPTTGIPQRLGVVPPLQGLRPQMTPAPAPTPVQAQGLRRSAGVRPTPIAPSPVAAPQRAVRAVAQQVAAPPPQFAFPTGGPSLQGYRAGSQQALSIRQTIDNPAFIPQAGSGLIASSTGNAYSIRPPILQQAIAQQTGASQGAYRPRSLLGFVAGQAIQQRGLNNQLRLQKMTLAQKAEAERAARDAQRLGLDRQRVGIDQQNANTSAARLAQERYQIFQEEVPTADGLGSTKVPMRLNIQTGEVSPARVRTGPSFDEFKAGVAGVAEFKGRSEAELMDYWKRNHGGQ